MEMIDIKSKTEKYDIVINNTQQVELDISVQLILNPYKMTKLHLITTIHIEKSII